MRFWVFFGTVVLILLLMQVYLASAVSGWIDQLPVSFRLRSILAWAMLAGLVYFNLSIPLRLVIRAFPGRDFSLLKQFVVFPGTTWLITMIMMFVLYVSRDAAAWVWSWLANDPTDPSRRAFLQTSGALGLGAPLVLTGYGALRTARDYRVEHVELAYSNLPPEFDGFQIAQISDIHAGIYMQERHLMEVREMVDSLRPQALAMTGDFVDTLAEEAGPVARIFSQAHTDYGVFACMGNHDLFDNYARIRDIMSDAGIRMLDNSHETIRLGGSALTIAGVGDRGRYYNYSDLAGALRDSDPDAFRVLLAHRPSFFDRSRQAGIDLQLSGHTHGGQIGLQLGPIPINPVYLMEKYARGLYTAGKARLYVNPGIGMVFAPIRIGVPPEITLFTLKTAN